MSELQQLPPSESHRLVKVQSYELHPGIVNDTWILVVEGTAPCANMNVTLEPAVYIRQPEWWRVEVVGSLPGGVCLAAIRSYTATLPAANAMGIKGIELVGKGYSQRIAIPPVAEDELEHVLQVGSVALGVLESEPRQLQITATGTASTPGWGRPRLEPRPIPDGLPDDGVLELDFLADRPDGIVPQVLVPISAGFRWTEFDKYADKLKGVRVHARTNAVEQSYKSEPPPGPTGQQQVQLPYGDAVEVDDGALTLCMVDVQDSRCPSNVMCVWQGFVAVTLEATERGGETQKLELSSLDGEPASIGPYRLKLVDVMPYPIAGPPPAHPPIATVLVMTT